MGYDWIGKYLGSLKDQRSSREINPFHLCGEYTTLQVFPAWISRMRFSLQNASLDIVCLYFSIFPFVSSYCLFVFPDMAVAIAISTHSLFRGTAASFLFYSRTGAAFFPAAAAASATVRAIRAPFAAVYRNNTSKIGRRRLHLSCYSTEAASQNCSSTASIEAEEEKEDGDSEWKKIREAANALDIRVGRVLKAWRHEEADSLYVEEVDVGEPETRIICSGLVNYIPLHLLQDRNVIVLANLKPRNMRGVKSNGMLMAASDATHANVELLMPPEGAVPGERVWFGSVDERENLPDAASPNQVQKKKIWELVQPHLVTDGSCVAMLGVHPMRTSAGVVISDSLKNANIS